MPPQNHSMPQTTTLPETALCDLLDCRLPVLVATDDLAIYADAVSAGCYVFWQGAVLPQPPLGQDLRAGQVPDAQAKACLWAQPAAALPPRSVVAAASAWQALQAQEAGAAAVLVPAAALASTVAVVSCPVVVDAVLEGRELVRALDVGAQAGLLAPGAALDAVLAQANALWPMFAASQAELASPVCYAPEFERERNAPQVALLNGLLAAERALARAAVHVPDAAEAQAASHIAACALLRQAVREMDAVPCTQTAPSYAALLALPDVERLSAWQQDVQQLQTQWQQALPRIEDLALRAWGQQQRCPVPQQA